MWQLLGILIMIVLCNITSVCEGFNTQNAKDHHDSMIVNFLQTNLPNLKTSREQLIFEINLLNKNSKELKRLSQSFYQNESKKLILNKLSSLQEQHEILSTQLSKLDNEVERNIAYFTFNKIDGGGTRLNDLKDLLRVTEYKINSARRINNAMFNEK